jgi:hypothetical protein
MILLAMRKLKKRTRKPSPTTKMLSISRAKR